MWGAGKGVRSADPPCSWKSIYKALHIHSSEPTDSTNWRSGSTVVVTSKKKSAYKWIQTVQTRAVQGQLYMSNPRLPMSDDFFFFYLFLSYTQRKIYYFKHF